jgi:lipid II:glycine glycyltransferase (peptidoglycan interpeptide bridge formation enzyme)
MSYEPLTPDIGPTDFNSAVTHPLQSFEWGTFREATGIRVIREVSVSGQKVDRACTITIHPIPRTSWNIGYLPKGAMPDETLIQTLQEIGEKERCVLIQLEPNVTVDEQKVIPSQLRPAVHPLFTKHTLQIDLRKSEDELLANMHSKTRYNIRVAQKHNVSVQEDNSPEAFKEYLKLTEETTKRQGFYAHSRKYHETQWQTLPHVVKPNQLSSHLLTATVDGKVLTAWILFVFQGVLYYPYGASSGEHRETMHSTAMMWEAIRYGKNLGLKIFDLWGALGADPDPKDPWFGFHRFKSGFGPQSVEFIGSYDLVINPSLYKIYAIADKLRWIYLKLRK